MSKSKVHVLIPFTSSAACGVPHNGNNGCTRESITCKPCRKTVYFKKLLSRKMLLLKKN